MQFETAAVLVIASPLPLRLERSGDASPGSPPHGDDRSRLGVRVPRQWFSSAVGPL